MDVLLENRKAVLVTQQHHLTALSPWLYESQNIGVVS